MFAFNSIDFDQKTIKPTEKATIRVSLNYLTSNAVSFLFQSFFNSTR